MMRSGIGIPRSQRSPYFMIRFLCVRSKPSMQRRSPTERSALREARPLQQCMASLSTRPPDAWDVPSRRIGVGATGGTTTGAGGTGNRGFPLALASGLLGCVSLARPPHPG